MFRVLPLLCLSLSLSLTGCFGLSSEEAANLARYQRNAATYYGGGDFERALDQVRRGLEIEPNDYKLHEIRAWCMLRQSQLDPRKIEASTEAFDNLLAMRIDSEQSPRARLGYGAAHGKLGFELHRRAESLRSDAKRLQLEGTELADRENQATQLDQESNHHFDLAQRQLTALLDSGDLLLEANYHLMYVCVWRGDYEGAVGHGNDYIARVGKLESSIRDNLENTIIVDYESELRIRLQNRLDQEVEVRAFLANLHFKQEHYELAVEQLNEVLLENPNRYNEYFNRANSLVKLGRMAEAKRDYERFLYSTNLPRENPQVKSALAALKEIE